MFAGPQELACRRRAASESAPRVRCGECAGNALGGIDADAECRRRGRRLSRKAEYRMAKAHAPRSREVSPQGLAC